MYKKMSMFKQILCPENIHEKTLLACPRGPTIQAVSVKWYPRNFVPKTYLQFWQSFQVSVKEKFYGPEISKKNWTVQGVWIFSWILHKH
jgi:hypothetical protein